MKKNIIIKGLAGLGVALSLGSCASDYLDLKPITSIDSSTVNGSVDGSQIAAYGVFRSMWWAESRYGAGQRFVQGEASVSVIYNDVFGVDGWYHVWAGYGANMFNWDYMNQKGFWMCGVPWSYYYALISEANRILDGIDTAEGDDSQRAFVKAQMLTMRAHSYERLLRYYAPRWEDSNNGEALSVVLRTTFSTDPTPRVSMNTVMNQIYSDLDLAIQLYQQSGMSRSNMWETDIEIAYGVYARAAMTKNDWNTAANMAKAARNGYSIMSADEYQGGFAEANGEWMWYNAPDPENVFYWSWAAMYGCNGSYTSYWGQGAGAINYDLYRQLHEGDIRKNLYLTPDKIPYTSSIYRPLTENSWWNGDIVSPVSMNLNASNSKMILACKNFGISRVPNRDEAKWGLPYTLDSSGDSDENIIPFGAQYKYWGLGAYSVTSFPFMRASEFALYEAEAAYHLGDEARAQACLKEVNDKRFTTPYDASAYTGQALMDEIMLTSRIEFWGEGHTLMNQKRWNVPLERRAWVAGDKTSNNIPAEFAAEFPVDLANGWTWCLPNAENHYNTDIR